MGTLYLLHLTKLGNLIGESQFKQSSAIRQTTVFAYFSENGICDGLQVDVAIIRQIVEDIGSTHGLWSSLAISKDEIDPMV